MSSWTPDTSPQLRLETQAAFSGTSQSRTVPMQDIPEDDFDPSQPYYATGLGWVYPDRTP